MKEFHTEVQEMVDQLVHGDEEVAHWVGRSRTIDSVQRIPGDASTRRYYRVSARDGQTYILMRMESFATEGMNLPFIGVQKHMHGAKIDVPQILDVDPERGYMLLEDLGDVTLLRHLQEVCSADVERHHYERVIDSLVDMHYRCTPRFQPPTVPGLDAFRLSFDHEKLMWEMNFTLEHFYQTYLKREIKASDLKIINDKLSGICQTLAEQPTVFTHRDFHSRNVMVLGDRFSMIDFQDARMGPAQYDLASLLKDSYYQLEEAQVDRLIDYYIVRWEGVSGERLDRGHFRYIFDLMHVQRNYKAIGSFASFLNRRGNATYLKYIGNTFENIRRTLLKYPEFSDLREVLFHYYYF